MLVSASGGVSAWSGGDGLPGLGGVCLVRGVSAWSRGVWSRGVLPARRPPSPPPPTVNRITDTCKNITLATTSLRPVKITKAILLFKVRLYDAAVTDLSVLGVTISEEMGARLNMQKPQKSSVLEACFSEVKSHTQKDSPKQYSYSRFVCMMRQPQT